MVFWWMVKPIGYDVQPLAILIAGLRAGPLLLVHLKKKKKIILTLITEVFIYSRHLFGRWWKEFTQGPINSLKTDDLSPILVPVE